MVLVHRSCTDWDVTVVTADDNGDGDVTELHKSRFGASVLGPEAKIKFAGSGGHRRAAPGFGRAGSLFLSAKFLKGMSCKHNGS